MGGSAGKDIVYAEEVAPPSKKGETGIFRNALQKDLLSIPKCGSKTLQEIFHRNFNNFASQEFLGSRPISGWKEDPKTKRKLPTLEEKYTYKTWGQVEEIIKAIGSGIEVLGLAPVKQQYKNYRIRFVGIHGKNSVDWILLDIANLCYGLTSMPLYDTLGEEAVDHMLVETEVSTIFMTPEHIKSHVARIKAGKAPYFKNIVIMEEDSMIDQDLKDLEGFTWYKFSQVIEAGKKTIYPYPQVFPEDVAAFSYTSGTTGTPKGAMLLHKNLIALLAGAEFTLTYLNHDTVYLSYLPLAHVLEKIVFLTISMMRGKYGLYGGDVLKIKDDLAILKPTIFVSVPRLFNKFHDTIKSKLDETTGCKGSIARSAVSTKLANVKTGKYTHWWYDTLVFNKMKAVLGGRVEVLLSGSAPLSMPVKHFMKIAFCCPFIEGYGQTEGCGGQFIQSIEDPNLDNVGGPIPHNEFKLIDVPEMNYFSTDKDDEGNPAPRGEILVRGANVIPDYYKNPEKTRETFDADGWLMSGDIGILLPKTRALKIIDRRKNIFKLSHGEYVAPDRLEQVYKTTTGIADIFVYGDSLKSVLVAIANLSEPDAIRVAKHHNLELNSLQELVKSSEFNKVMIEALKKTCAENGLKGFERINRIYFDEKTFAERDLVTTTFKLKRAEAKMAYQAQIDELYKGLD